MSQLFSIIIPVHNRGRYIKDTLRSVVGQEYRPIQLVLVDNNSTDNSISEAKEYLSAYESTDCEVVYTQEMKPGACAARNKGVTLAKAPYIMFLDDDDSLINFKAVSQIVERFESSEADIVGFKAQLYYSYKKKKIRHFSFSNDINEQILHCMLSTQCYASKRTFFDRVGGWDERIKRWQDWNLGVRLILLSPTIEWIKEEPLVTIRVHKDSITGGGYLHSSTALEESVLLTAEAVSNSEVEEKEQVIASIYGRLPILAAHYFREGGRDVSLKTLAQYKSKVTLTIIQKLLINALYLYTILGGRGAGRVINRMNVKLRNSK